MSNDPKLLGQHETDSIGLHNLLEIRKALQAATTVIVHPLNGVAHTVSGLTAGHFLKALSATTFGFAAHGLTYSDVGALAVGGTAADSDKLDGQHAAAFLTSVTAHQLDGALHTVSGLTAGHLLKALTPTTFGFAAHGLTYTDVGALAAGGTAVDSDKVDGQHASAFLGAAATAVDSDKVDGQHASAFLAVAATAADSDKLDGQHGSYYLPSASAYTDEKAQDAVGAMIGPSLQYVDATPLLDTIQDLRTTAGPTFDHLHISAVAAITTAAESWVGPSSTTGVYFKGGNVGIGTTTPFTTFTVLAGTRVPANEQGGFAVTGDTLAKRLIFGVDSTATMYSWIQSVQNGYDYMSLSLNPLGGNVKIAGTAIRGTTEGSKHLDIFDGTAPVGTLANGISLYSTAGELRAMDAAGNATLLSPHDKDGKWIYDSKDTVTGKVLRVDLEKMLKKLNDMFGWDFVHEFVEEI